MDEAKALAQAVRAYFSDGELDDIPPVTARAFLPTRADEQWDALRKLKAALEAVEQGL